MDRKRQSATLDHRNGPHGGYAYVDPAEVARADAAPRTLPPSTNGREALADFLDALQGRRELHAANAEHDDTIRRRVEAATRPLAVIPPRRGADLGLTSPVYVRTSFERQLPGNRPNVGHPRWPEGEHAIQEASFQIVHRGTPPRDPGTIAYGIGETDSAAREAAFDAWLATLDPEDASEPFVGVLDPSRGDRPGDIFLNARGFTRTGRPKSHATRGAERRPVEEIARRALVHCADLDRHYREHRRDDCSVTLKALRAPYRPLPGHSDTRMAARRAVAVSLRLEGFKTGAIALVLDREESRVEELIRDVDLPPSYRPLPGRPKPSRRRSFYQRVPDNWARRNEDSRESVSRWRKERKEIANDIRALYARLKVEPHENDQIGTDDARKCRIAASVEASIRRRLNQEIPAKRDRRDLPGNE